MKKSLANFVIFVKVLIVSLSIFFVTQSPAFAFQPDIHGQITVEVLNATQPVVNEQKLQFSQTAIDEIVRANKITDDPAFQTQSALHFDGEDFYWGSKRLIDFRERVVKKITTTNFGPSARADLGGAMHTLQDFYAHSNWVELGKNSINTDLGRKTFRGPGSIVATRAKNFGGERRQSGVLNTNHSKDLETWQMLVRCNGLCAGYCYDPGSSELCEYQYLDSPNNNPFHAAAYEHELEKRNLLTRQHANS